MGTKNERLIPFMPVAPGVTLKEELEARAIKQKDFSAKIGMRPSHFSELLKGKRSISSEVADKLESELGIPAKIWLHLQADYDYDCKVAEEKSIEEQRAQLLIQKYEQKIDVKLLVRKVKNTTSMTFVEMVDVLQNDLGLPRPSVLFYEQGKFHKSEKTGTDERAILTWVILARYVAKQQHTTASFNRDDDSYYAALLDVFNQNSGDVLSSTKDILAKNGVRFCVVEKIPHASVDGYSFMDNDGIPSIVVTMRYNRIDNLAFAVFHELAHLKLHLSDTQRSFVNLLESNKIEDEANKYASLQLVPDSIWRTRPNVMISSRLIQKHYSEWAEEKGINKWIVMGRIAHETGMYKFAQDNSREVSGWKS